jgi:hypothetical protein
MVEIYFWHKAESFIDRYHRLVACLNISILHKRFKYEKSVTSKNRDFSIRYQQDVQQSNISRSNSSRLKHNFSIIYLSNQQLRENLIKKINQEGTIAPTE